MQRSSGARTVAEVESTRPGWVQVRVDNAGLYKEVDERDVCRLIPLL